MSPLSLLYVIGLCAGAARGNMIMFVDRMWLAGVDQAAPVADVSYVFVDGDRVDVVCAVEGSGPAAFYLTYDFGEKSDIRSGYIPNNRTEPSSDIANAFRTTLRAAHDNARLTCRYYDDNSTDLTIHLTFTLQQTSADVLIVKIGSVPLRYRQLSFRTPNGTYEVWYNYMWDERAKCFCDYVSGRYVVCTANKQFRNFMKDGRNWSVVDDDSTLTCTALSSAGTTTLNIHYEPLLHNLLYDETPLALNVTDSLFELHAYKREQTIIYNYNKDELLVLNCSTLLGVSQRYNYYLVFDGTEERHNDSIIKRFNLTAAYDGTAVDCYLVTGHTAVRIIELRFWMKNAEEGASAESTQKYDEEQPLLTDTTLNTQTQQPTNETTTGEGAPAVSTQEYDEDQPLPTDTTLTTQTQQPIINETTTGEGAPAESTQEYDEDQPLATDITLNTQTQQPTTNEMTTDDAAGGAGGAATGHVSGVVFAGLAVLYSYWCRELTQL